MAEAGGRSTAKEAEHRRPIGDSAARYGANLLPVDHKSGDGGIGPLPGIENALQQPSHRRPRHGHHGHLHAAFSQGVLDRRLYQFTDATVVVPIGGRGRTRIGPDAAGKTFVAECGKQNIVIAPSWRRVRHKAAEDSGMFSSFDRPIQEALRLFRNDRGNA